MVANKENSKDERRMFAGIVWNCAAELKLFLTALLFLCTLATVLQFLPSRFLLSPSDLRRCLSTPTAISNSSSAPAPAPHINRDNTTSDGVLTRAFNPYGSAAYNFILMSAYRGGPHTFAVVGLSSKPLHLYGKPSYQCQWLSHNATSASISAAGYKILPDWGYGRVYTVVVVNCTFPTPAGADGMGGRLLVHAATNDGGLNSTDTIAALDESPEEYARQKAERESPPAYDYLYCGSSLYGNLSPQRVREWVAYHVKLLGAKSHFVIHDAGGVHQGLRDVLRPWMDTGFVTLQDVREQEKFDGYYHNQFLIVNDCLHRYRFSAKWIFFFDVDEFVFVPKKSTIDTVMDSLSEFTQFTMVQMPMSSTLCLSEDAPQRSRYRSIQANPSIGYLMD